MPRIFIATSPSPRVSAITARAGASIVDRSNRSGAPPAATRSQAAARASSIASAAAGASSTSGRCAE